MFETKEATLSIRSCDYPKCKRTQQLFMENEGRVHAAVQSSTPDDELGWIITILHEREDANYVDNDVYTLCPSHSPMVGYLELFLDVLKRLDDGK